ncbi:hypothetical protein BJ912DRAFT_991006 [Pholiota molesta]|nr:hypothetical protein BJ912DRAFT_991006 [Pholiota molesta]
MGSLRRLRILIITVTLVSHAYTGIALAIPAADSDTVSTDAMFDSSPTTGIDAESGLPPIKEAAASASLSDSNSLNGQPTPSLSPESLSGQPEASITATAQGPGIVLLSSTVLPGFSATSQNPEPTSTNTNSVKNNGSVNSSHRVLILGSVVGGILCVMLCIFFVLDPSVSARFLAYFSLRKFRSSKKDRGISHMAEPSSSFMVNRGSPERTFAGMNTSRLSPSPEKGEKGDRSISSIQFSICSSDYLSASTRDSAITSITTASDDMMSHNSASGSPRVRPRPMLSDSVYLACSNQPYVIVEPPALRSADFTAAAADPPPKKMLTPNEFFALHVPGIISSLVGNHASNNTSGSGGGNGSGKRERDRATMAVPHQPSGVARTGSQHSRTKSAPLLSSLRSAMTRAAGPRRCRGSAGRGGEGGDIAERVTKHRRSRSASGWAYPERLRPRMTFMH